jgi:hypothetical protein
MRQLVHLTIFQNMLFFLILLIVPFVQGQLFQYTGAYETFVIPPGVNTIKVEAYGAAGADSTASTGSVLFPGGKGGYVSARLKVTPGDVYYVYVGGRVGWNGGGYVAGGGGRGGDSTDLRKGSTALTSRVIVAGGGGGAGGYNGAPVAQQAGGAGGGVVGADGADVSH